MQGTLRAPICPKPKGQGYPAQAGRPAPGGAQHLAGGEDPTPPARFSRSFSVGRSMLEQPVTQAMARWAHCGTPCVFSFLCMETLVGLKPEGTVSPQPGNGRQKSSVLGNGNISLNKLEPVCGDCLVLAEASRQRARRRNHVQSFSSYAGFPPCSPLPLWAINGESEKRKKKGLFWYINLLVAR